MTDTPKTPDGGPLLLSARQVADLLGIGLSTWWRLVSSCRTPAPLKLARCTKWIAAEIRAWILAGCPSRDRWEAVTKGTR